MAKKHQIVVKSKKGRRKANRKYRRQEAQDLKRMEGPITATVRVQFRPRRASR